LIDSKKKLFGPRREKNEYIEKGWQKNDEKNINKYTVSHESAQPIARVCRELNSFNLMLGQFHSLVQLTKN
jgi:hypothetical protein